jgi:hypothetical protein
MDEQAWVRWVSKSANDVSSHKETLLKALRKVAHVGTEQAYNSAMNDLQQLEVKNNEKTKCSIIMCMSIQ